MQCIHTSCASPGRSVLDEGVATKHDFKKLNIQHRGVTYNDQDQNRTCSGAFRGDQLGCIRRPAASPPADPCSSSAMSRCRPARWIRTTGSQSNSPIARRPRTRAATNRSVSSASRRSYLRQYSATSNSALITLQSSPDPPATARQCAPAGRTGVATARCRAADGHGEFERLVRSRAVRSRVVPVRGRQLTNRPEPAFLPPPIHLEQPAAAPAVLFLLTRR